MVLTHLTLPRTFVDKVGFTDAVRQAARLPRDPETLKIFKKIAPNVDWERVQLNPGLYEPPRWLGYWGTVSHYWASDGVLKLVVSRTQVMDGLFDQVRGLHFQQRPELPYSAPNHRNPSHMLLHDSELSRVYVAPFEQAEAVLARQPRGTWLT